MLDETHTRDLLGVRLYMKRMNLILNTNILFEKIRKNLKMGDVSLSG